MTIQWFNDKDKKLVATIATTNITLNKPASNCIDDAYRVMLGISNADKLVYIKALNKEKATRGDIPQSHMYSISIRESYSRISNKDFINQFSSEFGLDFNENKKYLVSYDEKEHMLVIDLKREVV